jgi:Alternative oxidase
MIGSRHFRSLRTLKRDHGWIATLLEEAENERMHLLLCLNKFEAGIFYIMYQHFIVSCALVLVVINLPRIYRPCNTDNGGGSSGDYGATFKHWLRYPADNNAQICRILGGNRLPYICEYHNTYRDTRHPSTHSVSTQLTVVIACWLGTYIDLSLTGHSLIGSCIANSTDGTTWMPRPWLRATTSCLTMRNGWTH